jgi:hypothetical protein
MTFTSFIRSFSLVLAVVTFTAAAAQEDQGWEGAPALGISGFLDVFYVYDFNRPPGDFRQEFLFNHNRHSEFNLNLGLVGLSLEHSKYRAKVTLQTGTYANDNYAAEPGVLKNIFEAWAGVSLNRENTLWLDAGILPSHIGFESAVSLDNYTLTRSLSAENSPYFLTGAQLSYTPDARWKFAGLVVNGWQVIQKVSGNSFPSFGTQVMFTPSGGLTLNWSTFIGTEDPDQTRRMRYFSNLYGQVRITDKVSLLGGIDLGIQQKRKGSSEYDLWFTPTVIGQYLLDPRWKTAFRLEYYADPGGVIIPSETADGFRTAGISWNLDYNPAPQVACRFEARWLGSQEPVFRAEGDMEAHNFFLGASLAIEFGRRLNSIATPRSDL